MAGLGRLLLLRRPLFSRLRSLPSPLTPPHVASLSGAPRLPLPSSKRPTVSIFLLHTSICTAFFLKLSPKAMEIWQQAYGMLPMTMRTELLPSSLMAQRCIAVDSSPPSSSTSGGGTNAGSRPSRMSLGHILSSVAAAPLLPMSLGAVGAMPFIALTPPFPRFLPLPELLLSSPLDAQAAYAAVILSFLGGPQWGLAMVGINASPHHKVFSLTVNSVRYIWSVIPSLLGWFALLMPASSKFGVLVSSFGLVFAVDFIFVKQGLLPLWYLPLRLLLSSIAILCLLTSLLEVLISQKLDLSKHEDKQ